MENNTGLQETVSIILPVTGKQVVLRGYISGRVQRSIEDIFVQAAQISNESEQEVGRGRSDAKPSKVKQTTIVDPTAGQRATDLAITSVVLSVGDTTENILDAVLDLPSPDYQAIVDKVNEITNPDPKATSAGSTS